MKGIVNVKSYCEKARKVPAKFYCIDNVRTKQTGVKPRNKRSLGIHYCIFFFDKSLEGKDINSWRYRMKKKRSFMTASASYGITESTVDDIIAGKVLLPYSLLEVPLVLLGRQQMKKARMEIRQKKMKEAKEAKRKEHLKRQAELIKQLKEQLKRQARQAELKAEKRQTQLKKQGKKQKARVAKRKRPTYESEKLAKTMVEDLKRRTQGHYYIDV